jgi:hypothetical protein
MVQVATFVVCCVVFCFGLWWLFEGFFMAVNALFPQGRLCLLAFLWLNFVKNISLSSIALRLLAQATLRIHYMILEVHP